MPFHYREASAITNAIDHFVICKDSAQRLTPVYIGMREVGEPIVHQNFTARLFVIGFPFGYAAIEAKVAETILAIIDGADELDVVINISAIKNNDWQFLASEINAILPIIRKQKKVIKELPGCLLICVIFQVKIQEKRKGY